MASKDRILRLKEETRCNILDASLQIVKEEGWQALSMRKIADMIEYTAPIIYEYFANKDAILLELTKKGYVILNKALQQARSEEETPAKQLEAMWMAYWNFAHEERELYQVMFGIEMNCCVMQQTFPEVEMPYEVMSEVIEELMGDKATDEDAVCTWYYTCWSVVHGLISLSMVRKDVSDEINRQVLTNAITGIIRTIGG